MTYTEEKIFWSKIKLAFELCWNRNKFEPLKKKGRKKLMGCKN